MKMKNVWNHHLDYPLPTVNQVFFFTPPDPPRSGASVRPLPRQRPTSPGWWNVETYGMGEETLVTKKHGDLNKTHLTKIGWYIRYKKNVYIYICIYIWFRVPCCQSPPPHMVWVQNLRFGYIFMEPVKTHWYLQCFDKLGLRNRGICSVL